MPGHRIREIAALAGVSEATVDRVLHERGRTRASSYAAVRSAIAELDRRQVSTGSGSRELTIEAVVRDDPSRARLVGDALHYVRPRLRPQVTHTLVRTVPHGRPDVAAAALAKTITRRPQGVLVDLDDDPAVIEQATALLRAGIPVVTLNRPFPRRAALGHSGLDNRGAGATAAYLVCRSKPTGTRFAVAHGETMTPSELERVIAFTATIGDLQPGARVRSFALQDLASLDLLELGGLYVADRSETAFLSFSRLRELLPRTATIVGHRDDDFLPQIATQVFDFALDVSWEAVVAEGCRAILNYHRRGPGQAVSATPPTVLTPYNFEH